MTSSSSPFSVTSTVKRGGKLLPPVTFTANTVDPKNGIPRRTVAADNTQQKADPSSPQDTGSLKHLSYSCPGLTDNDSKNSCHIECVPFSFLFGMPPDVLEGVLAGDKEKEAEQQKKLDQEEQQKQQQQQQGNCDDGAESSSSSSSSSSPTAAARKQKDCWHSPRTAADARIAHKSVVTIPLYQRTYTWEGHVQGVKWWTDCIAKLNQFDRNADEKLRAINMHGTGKLILKKYIDKKGDDSMKVDDSSRQRVTLDDYYGDFSTRAAEPASWICVDGQQRVTTMSLLFAAMYEVACEVRSDIVEALSKNNNNDDKNDESRVDALSASKSACQLLEQMLFCDPEAAKQWARRDRGPDVARLVDDEQKKATNNNSDNNNNNNNTNEHAANQESGGEDENSAIMNEAFWPEGIRVPGARLIPSHVDRQPFYELVTRRLVFDENKNASSETTRKNSNTNQKIRAGNFSHATRASLQGKMMIDVFLPRVRALVAAQSASYSANVLDAATVRSKSLETLTRHLLTGVGFILVEIIINSRIAQIFLWLQEKSLFGMGAILFNPAPGVDFLASDLVRNLLMAPFMEMRLAAQEEKHAELWLGPIEVPVRRAIKRYLRRQQQQQQQQIMMTPHNTAQQQQQKQQQQQQKPSMDSVCFLLVGELEKEELELNGGGGGGDLFKSAFHSQVESFVAHGPKIGGTNSSKDKASIVMYGRFYSLFEWHLQRRMAAEKKRYNEQLREMAKKCREEEEEWLDDDDDGKDEKKSKDAMKMVPPKPKPVTEHERELCEWLLSKLAAVVPKFVTSLDRGSDDFMFAAPAAIRAREEKQEEDEEVV